jgi:hypothetical protein
METQGREPEGCGQSGIEAGNFEFFIEGADDTQVEQQDGAIDPERAWAKRDLPPIEEIPRGVGDFAIEDAIEIQIELRGIPADEDDPQGEQGGKHHPDGRILVKPPAGLEPFN